MQSGFTRIPVYSGVRQNICGILYVKDLILIDPDDETELGSVLAFRCQLIVLPDRACPFCRCEDLGLRSHFPYPDHSCTRRQRAEFQNMLCALFCKPPPLCRVRIVRKVHSLKLPCLSAGAVTWHMCAKM